MANYEASSSEEYWMQVVVVKSGGSAMVKERRGALMGQSVRGWSDGPGVRKRKQRSKGPDSGEEGV